MSIKLEDFDSSFNDASLISSKDEATQRSTTYKQMQQTRTLYLVYFLSTMGYSFSLTLSYNIIKIYSGSDFKEIGSAVKSLAFYSVFTGACTGLIWGFISDRFGRKAALKASLIGSALTMLLYGFSKSFNSLAFANSLLGIFNCSGIFIKTMIGETNCKVSRPKVFRYLPIVKMISSFLSPMIITPFFASRLRHINLDRDTSSIDEFHCFIPILMCIGINIGAYVLSDRCLNETLDIKRSKNYDSATVDMTTSKKMNLEKSEKTSIFGLSFSKDSLLLLIASSLLILIIMVYSKMSKEWPIMESSKGGLSLKIKHIMFFMPLSPIIMVTILLKYPYIYKNFGVLKQFKACFAAVGVLFILSLMLTLVAKSGSTFIVLSLYAISYSIERGVDILRKISFDLLLVESAEVSGNLGMLYGISNTLSGAIYLIISYSSKSLFTFSTENNLPFPLNFKLTWYLAGLSLIGYWLSSKINNKTQKYQETSREHEY